MSSSMREQDKKRAPGNFPGLFFFEPRGVNILMDLFRVLAGKF